MKFFHIRTFVGLALLGDANVCGFQIARRGTIVTTIFDTASPSSGSDEGPSIALTREEGKNEKLRKSISAKELGVNPLELPCIAHADGPDRDALAERLVEDEFDYVVVTSPEAARVLSGAWNYEELSSSSLQVAAVGKATEAALKKANIDVAFTPSKALATVLAKELPGSEGTRVVYPASCRAPGTLAEGLEQRGFEVVRLNTYDTVTASWTDEQVDTAQRIRIATFASPSSVKGWLKNTDENTDVLAACIGVTSATACRELGFDEENIFYPDSPGIDGWVEAIEQAMMTLQRQPQQQ